MQSYTNNVQDIAGNAIFGASVLVKTAAGATATIYSDDGVTTMANPITPVAGQFTFYAADGRYDLTVTAGASVSTIPLTLFDSRFSHATTYTAGTVGAKLKDAVNIKDAPFNAALDGVTSDNAAWAAAIATGKNIYWPPGPSRVTDQVIMQNGQILQGAGRTKSYFVIDSGFNMAATGVLKLGTSEPGAQAFDIGFQFVQADQGVRANITAYPPAINGTDIPRFILDRVRIEGAYDGIKATGNCGGAYIGFIEVGALRKGLQLDGALDFVHGGHWHFWPFGMTSKPALMTVYYDGVTKAAEIGRVDGLNVDSIATFRSWIEFTINANAAPHNLIGSIKLDGDGARLVVSNGVVGVGQMYDTKSGAPTADTITASAGALSIGQLFTSTSHAGSSIKTTGTGTILVNGGRMNFVHTGGSPVVSAGGLVSMDGVTMVPAAVAYTVPHVTNSGTGILQVQNCKWPGKGAGSGTGISVAVDSSFNVVSGNTLADWTYTAPANYTLGVYGPNAMAMKSWTPAPVFATMGDFVATAVAIVGRYREEVGGIWFECRLVFNTNAFTTAAGQFSISGLPIVKGATDSVVLLVGRFSNVTLDAGYTWASASIAAGASKIDLHQSGSNQPVAGIGVANVLPSKTNVEFSLSGFIPNV